MMKDRKFGSARLAIGGLFAVTVIGGGLLLTAAGGAKASVDTISPAPPVTALASSPTAPVNPVPPRMVVVDGYTISTTPGGSRMITSHRTMSAAELRAANRARLDAEIQEAVARADKAGHEADRAAHIADEVVAGMNIAGIVHSAVASARTGLAAQCAATGTPVAKNADWNDLATCGTDMRKTLRVSLERARQTITKVHGLTESQRAEALSGVDEALREIEADPDLGGTSK